MKSFALLSSLLLAFVAVEACSSDADVGGSSSGSSGGTDGGAESSTAEAAADTGTDTGSADVNNDVPAIPQAVDAAPVKRLEYASGAFGSIEAPKKITCDFPAKTLVLQEAKDAGTTSVTLSDADITDIRALIGKLKVVPKGVCSGFDGPVQSLLLENNDNSSKLMTPGPVSGEWVCSWSPDLDLIITEGLPELVAKLDALAK